jgi:hypothetical protein
MAIDFSAIDFKVDLPVPDYGLIAVLPTPCTRDAMRSVDALVEALGIKVAGSADMPHGFAVGGPNGQVEVFSASGAIRGRNTDQLSKYEDERRPWPDVVQEKDCDQTIFRLGKRASERLQAQSQRLLEAMKLTIKPADVGVTLGQWARLDESGKELESGAGRATVQYSYAIEGIPLIGAGAKTNVHFDPGEEGGDGIIARFFHVHRGFEAVKDVRLLDIEQAFEPLLSQTWSGIESERKRTRIAITAAEFGLLAMPADVPQRAAVPALQVEGVVSGLVPCDGREVSVRFGQYLSLVEPKALASTGYGTAGAIVPGQLMAGVH